MVTIGAHVLQDHDLGTDVVVAHPDTGRSAVRDDQYLPGRGPDLQHRHHGLGEHQPRTVVGPLDAVRPQRSVGGLCDQPVLLLRHLVEIRRGHRRVQRVHHQQFLIGEPQQRQHAAHPHRPGRATTYGFSRSGIRFW